MSLTPSFGLRVGIDVCEIPTVLRLAGTNKDVLLPGKHEKSKNMNDMTPQELSTAPSQPTQVQPTESKSSEFWTVFLLGLFLGVFGAHRFYAKKIKTGVLQLVTFGGCGIWSLVDVVTILLSKFKSSAGVLYRNPKPKVSWGIFAAAIIIGLMSHGEGNSTTIEGNTAKIKHTCSQTDTAYGVGRDVSEVIFHTAKEYPNITKIEVTVELDSNGVKDTYGNEVKGPLIMGTIEASELDEVRKYADAFSYQSKNQQWYEFQVKQLKYATALDQYEP